MRALCEEPCARAKELLQVVRRLFDLPEELGVGRGVEGEAADEQLEEDDAERPHIDLRPIGLPQHLRCEVLGRAPLVGESAVGLDRVLVTPVELPARDLRREAKVGDL